jgi:RNA polymerase sigma-70 factor (sigma-E family)
MARDAEYVAFVEAHWDRYLRLARILTGDRDRGEELLQDSLVRLYVRWGWVARRDPHPYLRRMLVNGNISAWRRRRHETPVEQLPEQAASDAVPGAFHDELHRALRALPQRQRAVVVLRHYEDLTEREVARTLGCTVGTVKSHHSRALRRLREVLSEHDVKEAFSR